MEAKERDPDRLMGNVPITAIENGLLARLLLKEQESLAAQPQDETRDIQMYIIRRLCIKLRNYAEIAQTVEAVEDAL